jgi:TPR repeat protein
LQKYVLPVLFSAASLQVMAAGAAPPADLGTMLHTTRLLQAGYQGQGVRIGVVSDGAVHYDARVRQQVLPAGVTFVGRSSGVDADEGDWMMQVVHQVAPRAELGFCAGGDPAQTTDCFRQLLTLFHADIVVDDVNPQPVYAYPTQKVQGLLQLVKEHPGVLFFTGAGNNGGGYYEGRWTPAPLTLDGVRYAAQDFAGSLGGSSDVYESFALPPKAAAALFLGTNADPAAGPSSCNVRAPQVTVVLLADDGKKLATASNGCSPISLSVSNPVDKPMRVRAAILLPANIQPERFALKLTVTLRGEGVAPLTLTYRTGGGAGNSATDPKLISVAAVDPNSRWGDSYIIESFANSGPQCLDYAGVDAGRPVRLPTPNCFEQPVFVVPDRAWVKMTGASGDADRPFIGDSAAGPAAAGVAALLLSAGADRQHLLDFMRRTAIAQTDSRGWNSRYGYGLMDADAAAVAAGALAKGHAESLVAFRRSDDFLRYRSVAVRARGGDPGALALLSDAAKAGNPNAESALASLEHDSGDNESAARWAASAADQGEPNAQGLLGSMYNRGWGVTEDPRAAQAWWVRAARQGIASALYNLGTTLARGRGAPTDPVTGLALMRAAAMRGLQFAPMNAEMADIQSGLNPDQLSTVQRQAAAFAENPAAVPMP